MIGTTGSDKKETWRKHLEKCTIVSSKYINKTFYLFLLGMYHDDETDKEITKLEITIGCNWTKFGVDVFDKMYNVAKRQDDGDCSFLRPYPK